MLQISKNINFIKIKYLEVILEKEVLITKDMTIGEVVTKYPQTMPVFFSHGLPCVGCHVANWESIEEGALAHGIKNVEALVKDLNKIAEQANIK